MTRWAYATTLPEGAQWHIVPTTFDTVEEAAEAAKRWMLMAASHNHIVSVRLEKLDEIKTA